MAGKPPLVMPTSQQQQLEKKQSDSKIVFNSEGYPENASSYVLTGTILPFVCPYFPFILNQSLT
jgi:hypothetical protein